MARTEVIWATLVGDAEMATSSFAYCVGRDQDSRQKLADLFGYRGLCVTVQAVSLKALMGLGQSDPKPSVVLIDMTDLPEDTEDDLDKLKSRFPEAEFLVTCPRASTMPLATWDPWNDIIERRASAGHKMSSVRTSTAQ